jgi:fucose permease
MASARIAVSLVFFLHGLSSGTWVSRIPAFQENLGLSVGALGLALLGAGLGSLLAMLPTGSLVARYGSGPAARWLSLATCAAMIALAFAADGLTLFLALCLFGASTGALDVSMNAQGSAIELRRGSPIMSSLHGLWSVGTMAGAAIGAILASLGVPVRSQFLAMAVLLAVALFLATRGFIDDEHKQPSGAVFVWPRGPLLALAAVVFCAVAAEGAMFDWSGVFLRRVLDAPEALAALAPSFFAGAMAVGRLTGDLITARFRGTTIARVSAVLAAAGIVCVTFAPAPVVVFVSLVAVGLGLSVLVPLGFGAAGRSTDMPPSTAIAAVATVGYFAFLVCPPIIGVLAEQLTLRGALLILPALLAVVLLLAPAVGDQRAATRT